MAGFGEGSNSLCYKAPLFYLSSLSLSLYTHTHTHLNYLYASMVLFEYNNSFASFIEMFFPFSLNAYDATLLGVYIVPCFTRHGWLFANSW